MLSVMATPISLRELHDDNRDIMRRLDASETFIVTRNGIPVGALTPLRRRRFVSSAAVLATFTTAPRIDARRFRADLAAVADRTAHPRA
jgi:antitoxin (DNA-binding transcriptional repressor) of toxin-antitoxin stability system